MEHPSNAQVALALDELAAQLEFIGRRYPARAYRRAALTREQVANARPWHELRELQPRWRA